MAGVRVVLVFGGSAMVAVGGVVPRSQRRSWS